MNGCHVCQTTATALFRVNPKGQPGVFACSKHVGRVGCAVLCCRRTREAHYAYVWICAEHWRTVPRAMKQPYFRLRRLARADGRWSDQLWTRYQRILRRLAREATERAFMVR